MPDVEEIIRNSVEEAGLAETNEMGEFVAIDENPSPAVEEPAHPEGEETTETVVEGGAAAVGEDGKPVEKKADTETTEGDATDRELQGLGIQPKDARGGESKIRYSRVRKIWDNWGKKLRSELSETHGKVVKDFEQKIQANAERLTYMDSVNHLIKTDKRKYLDLLVMADPEFKQYLNPALYGGGGATTTGGGVSGAPSDDKMPEPDAKFADGGVGYSPEGLQKVLEWNSGRVIKAMEERFSKQYGKPLENLTTQQRTEAERQMNVSRVQENVRRAKEVYGQAFTDDFGELGSIKADSAIVKALKDNPRLSFTDACAVALIPKIQADRTSMRQDILKELEGRPRAAKSGVPESSKASTVATPTTTEGIIREEMRKVGMLG